VFPIKRAMDPDGEGIVDEKDAGCFLKARAGDHFMCQFQCDLCHFRNIQRRDPVIGNVKDSLSSRCIRRANLDAMWAREPTTVGGNLREIKKVLEKGSVLGYAPESLVVPAGPFPLRDDRLMSVASTMMLCSLDAGKNEPCVQYNTVHPMRSAVSNQWRASLDGQTASVMMRGTTKLITSTCPTNGEWFERFMLGYHKRVGDVSRPDLAITIKVMVTLMVRCERLWRFRFGESFIVLLLID
jgi:hypothetical protein